jgi:hypothetical protein
LKKEAKNFCYSAFAAHVSIGQIPKRAKVFCFFFSKNKSFCLTSTPLDPPHRSRRRIDIRMRTSSDMVHLLSRNRTPRQIHTKRMGIPLARMTGASA